MKRTFPILITLLLIISIPSTAQEKPGFFRKVDNVLRGMHQNNKMDSTYVVIPAEKLGVRLSTEISQNWIEGHGYVDKQPLDMRLVSETRFKEKLTVSYRNLALGVAYGPRKIKGQKDGLKLSLKSYGNKFGFNVSCDRKNIYGGNVTYGDEGTTYTDVPGQNTTCSAEIYYACNRKFSMNSVYGMSFIQKKSAGSVFFTVDGIIDRTFVTADENIGNPAIALTGAYLGFGAGYGYNYVPAEGWTIHTSVLPALFFVENSKLSVGNARQVHKGYVPDFCATARLGVNHQMGHWFAGLDASFKDMGVGRARIARTDHMTLLCTVSLGRRF